MTNVPFEYFGFYAFVEPFLDGYYKVGDQTKAHELFEKLKTVYQERLAYYASLDRYEQEQRLEDILGDMEAYRRNIDILIRNDDQAKAESETLIFNEFLDRFTHFIGADDQEYLSNPQLVDPDLQDSMVLDSIPLDSIPSADSVSSDN